MYRVGKLTPQTQTAIENDIIADYHDLTHGVRYGKAYTLPVDKIIIDIDKGSIEVSPEDFINKYNGKIPTPEKGVVAGESKVDAPKKKPFEGVHFSSIERDTLLGSDRGKA